MSKETHDDAFIVFHEGVALELQWETVAPHFQLCPAYRICAVKLDMLYLITADNYFYTAYFDAAKSQLRLYYQRDNVVDVDFCRESKQLFIVTADGNVFMQYLSNDCGCVFNEWQTLSFDPLELSEEGICIQRVCCSAQGILFLTQTGEIYVMGSCGDVFSAEMQPKHMRFFEEDKTLLDVAAGDDFFVMMLKRNYNDKEDPMEFLSKPRKPNNRPVSVSGMNSTTQSSYNNTSIATYDINMTNHNEEIDADKKLELNSNSSVRSFSSKSSNALEIDFETSKRQLLKDGYELIHTQVHTFGAINNGLLGTGDHIKRSVISNIDKLDATCVCSIAAGRGHSLARTLDGCLFHWGLNTEQQLSKRKDLTDLSAPTEIKLDNIEIETPAERHIIQACCGDFQTVILNARSEIQTKNGKQNLHDFNKDFIIQMQPTYNATRKCNAYPLLLASGNFTLANKQKFQFEYYTHFNILRLQLRLMLKFRHAVEMLELFQQKSPAIALKQLHHICQCYQNILCLLASLLKSLECFYRGEFENPADLRFIFQYRECIDIFEEYTQSYCDLYSIDAFSDAAKVFKHFSNEPLLPDRERDPCEAMSIIFQQPFQVIPYLIQFLEHICKSHNEYKEHLLAWQAFDKQYIIDLELAENTHEFWIQNERNMKIKDFRRKWRRVILTSATKPLKLGNSALSMNFSPNFILFSDCLCQSGSQLKTYPLVAMWLKTEQDNAITIITPERTFTVIARSPDDKKVWFNQLESSIATAIGQARGVNLSSIRTTAYVYSRNHSKFPGVHAYGRWCNGVMHGNCYLEYPDGKFYFGEMRRGEIEGCGKMVIPSVGLYEGSFKAGKFHGHGIFEMKDNEIYEGNFRDGMFHGHGYFRSNDFTYVGEYQANDRCGYGILDNLVTGEKYMGMFADNKRAGAGTCITMNGDYFEGIFADDDLSGTGIAVFENDYYYEGELTMQGPLGKGIYFMPNGEFVSVEDSSNKDDELYSNCYLIGNILSGQLGGKWQDVRVISGSVAINKRFPKYPKSIGALVVDNERKWRSLFDNFKEEILDTHNKTTDKINNLGTKHLWNRIAAYMSRQRQREKKQEQQDTAYQSSSSHSYFARNISLGFNSNSADKISLKSTNSLLTMGKSTILDFNGGKRSHSQETLHDADMKDLEFMNFCNVSYQNEESFSSTINAHFNSWANGSNISSHSSYDSVLNLSGSLNNNSFSIPNGLDVIPNYGINTLTEDDVAAIKDYLCEAFKDRHHPLYILNQRITNCFYTSYGCWKVKPTPILAKQAMREWESISKRVYKFVRKMFPALPEDFYVLESSREVISHITLLYPLVLSEGIYSTLFVLYANKYSRKDELYRQNLLFVEKLNNCELARLLGLDSTLLPVVESTHFFQAIQTLKQLQEKYSPKAMLTVIEKCMQHITDAHKIMEKAAIPLAADSMMPLTLFLVLRASVPHLGAELALLDDLTGGANFQFEMNGIAGYCYTTLKAAYEHITSKPLSKA